MLFEKIKSQLILLNRTRYTSISLQLMLNQHAANQIAILEKKSKKKLNLEQWSVNIYIYWILFLFRKFSYSLDMSANVLIKDDISFSHI